jgi:4-hydroxy-tetrahydrodipicolinate reductase
MEDVMQRIRVIQYGLGPIGCATAKALLEKKGIDLVGAVDIAPDKVGRDLGEILGLRRTLGVRVTDDAPALFRKVRADVVAHCTRSFLRDVYEQLEQAAKAGLCVVSSTEELLYPQLRNPGLAVKLDGIARRHGSTILGTGVNPGFVMDTLALVLTGVSKNVRSVKMIRRVDASTRRMPLQRKVGAGMKPAEFRNLVKQGKLGHIGLMESMFLVAEGLGWKLTTTREKIEPVVATRKQVTKYFTVAVGQVAGIKHSASGYCDARKVIDMDLRMYIGAPDPMDAIEVDGDPKLQLVIHGGVAGDVATVASLVNAIPRVLEAEPGLKTMIDLPIPRAFRAI